MFALSISGRVLTLLQFTRMALVFTAISNGITGLLLRKSTWVEDGASVGWTEAVLMALVSVGLYGFGMSLNDLIDQRRDRLVAAHRPLPSGRLSQFTAHAVCLALLLLALGAGYLLHTRFVDGWASAIVLGCCVALILFYDLAGKYLVAAGLVAVGLIRLFHASIGAPMLPVPLHPMLLFMHVTILSIVCYHLENKRPALNRGHLLAAVAGLLLVPLAIGWLLLERRGGSDLWMLRELLQLDARLLWPVGSVLGFAVVSALIIRANPDRHDRGQTLMLYGLLWLIVIDAGFVAGFVGGMEALAVLALLPAAYGSVRLVRGWARLRDISRPPQFQRVEIHRPGA